MDKFFRIPFADLGDKTAVPDAVDPAGNVSYSQGWGFDYQRQETDPEHKNIERDKTNQLMFDITNAVGEIQSQGIPDFITTALNGGTAYSYALHAVVRYGAELYISLVAANTALPTDATKWAPFSSILAGTFDASLLGTGWVQIPTGLAAPMDKLIFQWGSSSTVAGNANVTLPKSYPNSHLRLLVAESDASGWATNNFSIFGTYAKTLTGFRVKSLQWTGAGFVAVAGTFDWWSVGF